MSLPPLAERRRRMCRGTWLDPAWTPAHQAQPDSPRCLWVSPHHGWSHHPHHPGRGRPACPLPGTRRPAVRADRFRSPLLGADRLNWASEPWPYEGTLLMGLLAKAF